MTAKGDDSGFREMTSCQSVLSSPELLDMIFDCSEFRDIQSCRLVCRKWRAVASKQIKLRSILKLQKRKDCSVQQQADTINPNDFQRVCLLKTIPNGFENQFKETLTCLYLKKVTFVRLDDLRRIIFQTFPEMVQLGLHDLNILDRSAGPVVARSLDPPMISNVQLLHLMWRENQFFRYYQFEELVKFYSSSLQDFYSHCIPGQDVFGILEKYGVCLRKLAYNFAKVADRHAFKKYLHSCGNKLVDVNLHQDVIGVTDNNMFNDLFRDAPISQLECICVVGNLFEKWFGGTFAGLKKLWFSGSQMTSFNFLQKMPNLEDVSILNMPTLHESWTSMDISYQAPSVHTLKITYVVGVDYYECLSTVFPNVIHLFLNNADLMALNGVSRRKNSWSKSLTHIKLKDVHAYLKIEDVCRKTLGQGEGDENLVALRQLLNFPHIKSFECMDQIYFGDSAATKVFLRMPSLRCVRIKYCAVSPSGFMDKFILQYRKK